METNLVVLVEQFGGNDDACREYLELLRWPNGVTCPRCGSDKISRIPGRDQFDCDFEACGYQFSVTAGTIFNNTHLSLWKWFLAVYLMCEGKKGISANQLGRSIRVAYKTAWYLCHRIRKAMAEVDAPVDATMTGGTGKTFEMDETYTRRERRHVGSGNPDNKTMILGALERGGQIMLRVERHTEPGHKQVLDGVVNEATKPGISRVCTDQSPGRGDVHTNGKEGAWSLFRRSLIGSYHQVSRKHIDRYVGEFEFRLNNRDNPYLFRDTLCRLLATEKMEYKELVKSA